MLGEINRKKKKINRKPYRYFNTSEYQKKKKTDYIIMFLQSMCTDRLCYGIIVY